MLGGRGRDHVLLLRLGLIAGLERLEERERARVVGLVDDRRAGLALPSAATQRLQQVGGVRGGVDAVERLALVSPPPARVEERRG